MRPDTTELEQMFIEEWSDPHERTTEWTPKYLQALRMHTPTPRQPVRAPNPQSDLWLYAACGAAALLLGLLLSRALAPLIVGTEITLPKELLEAGPAIEAPRAARLPAAAVANKDTERPHKRPRSAAAKNHTSNRAAPPPRAAAKCVEPEQANNANALPDMDLMDAPSSPMEQRAIANSRSRSEQLIELQRQHDPMGQLDVMQDPGVALGTLRINSRPWSQVFIDNKPVGTTPLLNVSVSAGQHSVRLVNSVFGMRKTFDIDVGAGENISQVVSLDD